jgi:hypothetical protein
MEFASQISISLQQVPNVPDPALGSLSEPLQPRTLAYTRVLRATLIKKGKSTHLTVDELDIMRALRITISSPIFRAGIVIRELAHPTVCIHLHEVQRTIEAAGEIRHVDVKGELLVLKIERLVVGLVRHEVDTRADIGVGYRLERESVAYGSDAEVIAVVRAVKGTVL